MKIFTKLHQIVVEKKFLHVGIYCKINQQNAFFLLDTGASRSVIDNSKLTYFHLEYLPIKEDEKVLGIGTTPLEISLAQAKSFSIEDCELKNIVFVTLDLSHINNQLITMELQPIDGIMGNDFLMSTKAIINYRKLMLELTITPRILRTLSQL
ncbi:MAG: retropepsin-like domain-containing protein [Bacteroidales bacterium]|nr:retropepsin-like domain-containing protein [Bacteroidales bacterium]